VAGEDRQGLFHRFRRRRRQHRRDGDDFGQNSSNPPGVATTSIRPGRSPTHCQVWATWRGAKTASPGPASTVEPAIGNAKRPSRM
jgi:hypothetical protein